MCKPARRLRSVQCGSPLVSLILYLIDRLFKHCKFLHKTCNGERKIFGLTPKITVSHLCGLLRALSCYEVVSNATLFFCTTSYIANSSLLKYLTHIGTAVVPYHRRVSNLLRECDLSSISKLDFPSFCRFFNLFPCIFLLKIRS